MRPTAFRHDQFGEFVNLLDYKYLLQELCSSFLSQWEWVWEKEEPRTGKRSLLLNEKKLFKVIQGTFYQPVRLEVPHRLRFPVERKERLQKTSACPSPTVARMTHYNPKQASEEETQMEQQRQSSHQAQD